MASATEVALVYIFTLLLVVVVTDDTATSDPPKAHAAEDKLKIEQVFLPETCVKQTKKFDMVTLEFDGYLRDGFKFETSQGRAPMKFQLGIGQVIKGWDDGLLDMCVGEKRKLTIPPSLGYGDHPAGDKVPKGATMIFDIELVKIEDGKPPENLFKKLDVNNDNQLNADEVTEFIKIQAENAGKELEINGKAHMHLLDSIFEHEDKNKDGFISHEEFNGPKHDEL